MNKKILIGGIFGLFIVGLLGAASLAQGQYASVDQEINDLNQKIADQKKQLDAIQVKKKAYQVQIDAKIKEKNTLTNQLSIIENHIAKAQLDIDGANLEIDETSLEIKKIELDVANLNEKIDQQKNHIAGLLNLLNQQDQVSTLEMLLSNNSLADFLNQAKYLEDANQELMKSVTNLQQDKSQLDQNRADLNDKNNQLLSLKAKLEDKKSGLNYDQASKTDLLTETKSSERQYQALLQQAINEQNQAEADLSTAETRLRQKMSQTQKNRLNSGNSTIGWPVPRNMVMTTFHDPDYPYRNILGEHPGWDIRAKQGTTLLAAADGYVAKVKSDGTKNYAYIMIIHGNGLATVYGHVSAVYVSQDQYVTQGQPIGRSGGMPGGIGSGPFTTGPHLHFEVRLNGIPVDPANYLN